MGHLDARPGRELKSHDAVIVVPGIMGSELHDRDGKLLWGLAPQALLAAYRGNLLDLLRVTDEDLEGTRGIRATGLLRYPTILGWFLGNESYAQLVTAVSKFTLDPRAVAAFPYDWRLAVVSNGGKLADFALQLWDKWRKIVSQERLGDPERVGITIVAHSMGGLLARAAQLSSLDELPTTILTLGTPYYGSIKALRMLAEGAGGPLPGLDSKVRNFARTSPGLFDLLPRYKCVTTGSTVRQLTSADVAAVGANADMADASLERWSGLSWRSGPGSATWHTAVGDGQPTLQAITLDDGAAVYHEHLLGDNYGGDGTVYRRAAAPGWRHQSSTAVAQTHGALIASDRMAAFIRDKLLGQDALPLLGTSYVSAAFPEAPFSGSKLSVRAARFPVGATDPVGSHNLNVRSKNLTTNQESKWLSNRVGRDGWMTASHAGLPPGLHRVSVEGGGADPVTQLVWVADKEA